MDASKDGDAWCFPQSKDSGFDVKKRHQGEGLADHFRSLDMQVDEIPRGEGITKRLKGATVVFRFTQLMKYKDSKVRAYREWRIRSADPVCPKERAKGH